MHHKDRALWITREVKIWDTHHDFTRLLSTYFICSLKISMLYRSCKPKSLFSSFFPLQHVSFYILPYCVVFVLLMAMKVHGVSYLLNHLPIGITFDCFSLHCFHASHIVRHILFTHYFHYFIAFLKVPFRNGYYL